LTQGAEQAPPRSEGVPILSRDHVEALSSALAAYGKGVRRAIDQTDELGYRDTADIFTEISRGVDKYLWFVEAHLG
jgi:starvation-inducible DNA-binding protein